MSDVPVRSGIPLVSWGCQQGREAAGSAREWQEACIRREQLGLKLGRWIG